MIKLLLSCYFSPPIQLGRKMAHGKPATPLLTSVCLETNSFFFFVCVFAFVFVFLYAFVLVIVKAIRSGDDKS